MQTQSALVRTALKTINNTWIADKHGRYFSFRSRNRLIRKLEPFITHSITTIINNTIHYITLHIAPYQQS